MTSAEERPLHVLVVISRLDGIGGAGVSPAIQVRPRPNKLDGRAAGRDGWRPVCLADKPVRCRGVALLPRQARAVGAVNLATFAKDEEKSTGAFMIEGRCNNSLREGRKSSDFPLGGVLMMRFNELALSGGQPNMRHMKFLAAIFVYALISVILGAGILMAMKGSLWLLIAGLAVYVITFAKVGCLPKSH